MTIHLEPPALISYLGMPFEELPIILQQLVQTQDWQTTFPSRSLTPAMQIIVQQILNCPYVDIVQKIYLQSKVYELLALHLEPILSDAQLSEPSTRLKPKDIDLIHYARDILLSRIENPPSLLELAKLAGINDHKLKNGFRQVFGTTVFGYLHDQRMKRSRLMLEEGKRTVAETAWAVGFASRSHFSTAFKRKFGIAPSAYLQGKRV
jgi:AraC-like DNA-binding protein